MLAAQHEDDDDVKARIDKTPQNNPSETKTVNHVISECMKLSQKGFKNRHDWVGKVINEELCKKFKFDLKNK